MQSATKPKRRKNLWKVRVKTMKAKRVSGLFPFFSAELNLYSRLDPCNLVGLMSHAFKAAMRNTLHPVQCYTFPVPIPFTASGLHCKEKGPTWSNMSP